MSLLQSPAVWPRWAIYTACALIAGGFRYLLLGNGFSNDHFVYITGGWQIVAFGEWPTRDFVDAGAPLATMASAAAQAIFGQTVLAEAVLVSAAFGIAAAVTCAAVRELTKSMSLAVLAAFLEVAVLPRSYGYPKMLVYSVAFLCFLRYVGRPALTRMLAMAAAVALAFLFRHDHGVFLGVGAGLTVILAPPLRRLGKTRDAMVFAGITCLLLSPYLIYVQAYEGLARHFGIGAGFSQQEFGAQQAVWPAVFGDATPFASALVYEYYAIPIIVLIAAVLGRRTPDALREAARVAPIAIVALLVNGTFLREPLAVRLPDAIVPAVVLGAWLVARARASMGARLLVGTVAVACVALFSASVLEAGDTLENLDRVDLTERWRRAPDLFRETTAELLMRFPERQWPSRAAARLRPFYDYLDRCTMPEHRLLVGGFLVDVPFYARRPFAGGQRYFGGSYGWDEAAERLALDRLDRQVTPFALLPTDYSARFESAFPKVVVRIRSRYTRMTEVPVTEELTVVILVDSTLAPTRRDPQTGWPCFRP